MSRSSFSKRDRKGPFKNLRRHLNVEALEDRSLMTCNVISGYVYYDINNNGLYEANLGETPIANSTIELRNASNVVVGSTTTDATGHYAFEDDISQPGVAKQLTATKVLDFPTTPTPTNYDGLKATIGQFDPSLGTLESVEITYGGTITSTISGTNVSPTVDPDIVGTVSGELFLSGPGVTHVVNGADVSGDSFTIAGAGGEVFNTAGGSTFNLGTHSADGSKTLTLTGAALNSYIGTGQVDLFAGAHGHSNVEGGGYLDSSIRTTGKSTVTVTYHYAERPCLAPGEYTITQTQQPDGYLDGKEAKDGVVDPNSVGTDVIHVTLAGVDLVNNNFGEVKTIQLSGHVWYDANNDGVRDATEDPIPGTTITLTGPGGTRTTTTDVAGYYEFLDLDPGAYTVKETQPAGYLDGKDNAGTKGGTVVNNAAQDQIQAITLADGDNSQNNDFGEIKPSSIAGHVWYDANDDGVFDPGELPIPGATVRLTGFDDKGPVSKTRQTNSLGEYKFDNLRPGTYALRETQPAGYSDGKDAIGTPGGDQSNDFFDHIVLPVAFDGVNNDFGEIRSDTPGTPDPKSQGLIGVLPFISKTQRTYPQNLSNIPIALRQQMAFVVAARITLVGQQPGLTDTFAGVQAVRTGTTQSYIQQLWSSDAHRALQVNEIYQDVLQRAPTAAEKAQMIADLKGGASKLDLLESLYVAPEYQTLHGTQESLAVALSRDILNVTPGTTATQSLVQAMDNQPLNQVVHDLLTSESSLANLIDDVYRQTLRRAATTAEIQLWTPQIVGGTLTLDALAQRLLSTQEFQTLAFNRIH